MKNKPKFKKYQSRSAGYHWDQISKHPIKRNAFVLARYKNVISLLGKTKNEAVLDLGCGDGVLSYLLYEKGLKVSGIDLSEEAIEFAKNKTNNRIEFKVGSVYHLPWEDNSFDIVLSSDVIEHLEDVSQYLKEIKRVLKPNGKCVISTPIRITEIPLDTEHVVEWFENEYRDLINNKFPGSSFYKSHPIIFMEMMNSVYFKKQWVRFFINLLSIFGINIFQTFKSKFRYFALQYSVSINKV